MECRKKKVYERPQRPFKREEGRDSAIQGLHGGDSAAHEAPCNGAAGHRWQAPAAHVASASGGLCSATRSRGTWPLTSGPRRGGKELTRGPEGWHWS
jgi:hypothetical protein